MGAVDEAYGGAVKEANNDAVEETGGDTFGEVEAAEEGQWGALAIVRRETRPPLEGSSLAKILGLPTGEVPWCRGEGVPRPPMVRKELQMPWRRRSLNRQWRGIMTRPNLGTSATRQRRRVARGDGAKGRTR
jgi:hypothetical protein